MITKGNFPYPWQIKYLNKTIWERLIMSDKYCSKCGQELKEVSIIKRIIDAHANFQMNIGREPINVYVGKKEYKLIQDEFIELDIQPNEVLMVSGLYVYKVDINSHFKVA